MRGQSRRCCYDVSAIRARNSFELIIRNLNKYVVLTDLINASEITSLNAECRGLLRLHTDVLAVGGVRRIHLPLEHPVILISFQCDHCATCTIALRSHTMRLSGGTLIEGKLVVVQ